MQQTDDTFQWKIAGEAGFGIMNSGEVFAKCCLRQGFHVFAYTEYPSLIRGGHNTFQVRISKREVFSQGKLINLLVALNKASLALHMEELGEGSIVLHEATIPLDKEVYPQVQSCPLPLSGMIRDLKLLPIMINNICLGASMALCGWKIEELMRIIEENFARKGQEVVTKNQEAARAGYAYMQEHYPNACALPPALQANVAQPNSLPGKQLPLLVTGNDALALGAVAAGCKFYAGYPMTPASSILTTLASFAHEASMMVRHAEDEIAAINMTIGAGFAGVRAMCGTSGGGFCLMTEGYGLAAITETPIVVVNAQRPGPATGLPTWTEQGDLQFVLHPAQGEFPMVVIAPGDVAEAFTCTTTAFTIAEEYQTPVMILSDKYLAESYKTTKAFPSVAIRRGLLLDNATTSTNTDYKRYRDTPTGVSPRVLPGQPGTPFLANSYEHDEHGFSTEDAAERKKMQDKRMRKYHGLRATLPKPAWYGPADAPLLVIGWGSTKGPILEALQLLAEEGILVSFLHLVYISPFPAEEVKPKIMNAAYTLCIENNSTGQMAQYIREQTGMSVTEMLLKYDGRPFYPEEIYTKLAMINKEINNPKGKGRPRGKNKN
ncbi:2-oxoacid:acceptor oxidoreductase subunit alpha [Candidatus Woesearchaeota archaeon]|nr:2-oxoacid:acceptor oxidoreductase subunit alpha [Candidatus Woesearchaeota archaeon]